MSTKQKSVDRQGVLMIIGIVVGVIILSTAGMMFVNKLDERAANRPPPPIGSDGSPMFGERLHLTYNIWCRNGVVNTNTGAVFDIDSTVLTCEEYKEIQKRVHPEI